MGNEKSDRVLIFTRYPIPGQTKTRLIPALGAEKAAALHRYLTEQLLARVDEGLVQLPFSVAIYYTGCDRNSMVDWLGDRDYRLQIEGDLGVRMQQAFTDAFAQGMQKVVIIGTDCPDLGIDILRSAFEALDQNGVVVGVAADGGYYLLGMRRLIPELFEAMPWGSDRVFAITYQRIKQLQITCHLLPVLRDLDRPEDLDLVKSVLAEF